MPNLTERPAELEIVCNENLHRYMVPTTALSLKCPECGCEYGRIAGAAPVAEVIVDVKEPYALTGVESWVSRLPQNTSPEEKPNA